MFRWTSLATVSAFSLAIATPASAESLRLLGEFSFPTGISIDGLPFGGISAMDYDAATDSYVALSDDRAEFGPVRYYRLEMPVTADGIGGLNIVSMTEILNPEGESFIELGADPEAMRLTADGTALVWAHERDEDGVPYAGIMSLGGEQIRSFSLPAPYLAPRTNLSFESLTLSTDGAQAILAVEGALESDGPEATLEAGTNARILVVDLETGEPAAEYVYVTEPVADAPNPADAFKVNGLVEMLAKPDGSFYALERSFSVGAGYTIWVYSVSLDQASDVSGMAALDGADFTPVSKDLVLEITVGDTFSALSNLETLSFGPTLEDGTQTLVIAADNNFSNWDFNQFLVFAIED